MIILKNICKSYDKGKTLAVNNISLSIASDETLVLLGSSGCGKTTLLKMINRLIRPTSGEIFINSTPIRDYPKEQLRRSIGYVFQSVGLFAHMTVERNIGIVLELNKVAPIERQKRVYELMEMINLSPQKFADRYPDELSGGQQQRVGVARALAANPKCLLMDEPFGALDAITRSSLQDELLQLNSKLKKTIIFVTHDINEAFRIADRIAIMDKGQLQQVGSKNDILHNPQTKFVQSLIENYAQQIGERI